MAAVRGDKTLAELAQQYDVHPNQIQEQKVKELHAKIGELMMDRDFLSKALGQGR